jgi:protease-4
MIEFVNVQDLIKKIGVEYHVLKTGKYKDIGSPFREMTKNEREVMREFLMDVYDQFLNHVDEHRNEIQRDRLEQIADGRIFTGRQSKELNLIDVTGTRHDAISILEKAANIEEAKLVQPARNQFSLADMQSYMGRLLNNLLDAPRSRFRLLYMMKEWDGFAQ